MKGRTRLARSSDAGDILEIYAPFVEDTAVSFEEVVPSLEEIERRIVSIGERFPWLVREVDGQVVGYAYACSHRSRGAYRWSVETSAYVRSGLRRRGVGRRLYHDLLRILRRQGFAQAFAGITLPNPASVSFHESLGFEAIGRYREVGFKLGQWHDTVWMQRALVLAPLPPQEPRSVLELLSNRLLEPEWLEAKDS